MLLELIGWALFAFGAVRLAVGAVNKFSRPYLRSRPGDGMEGNGNDSALSVLIPARNEEKNIGRLLEDLLRSGDGFLEILVYDDRSDDGTARIVSRYSAQDGRIRLVSGEELPAGWLGKNRGCFRLAQEASGKELLFMDADVRIVRGALDKAVFTLASQGVGLLSVFPHQLMPSAETRLAVPLMNWILLSLLPLIAVRRMPQPSLAAANGQFMLFDAETYRAVQPHSLFRGSAVEDMSIVEEYKKRGIGVSTLLGNHDVSCRMYETLSEAVNGFAKNVFRFFGGHVWLAFGFAAATTLAPFWIWIFNGPVVGIIYIGIIATIRVLVSMASRQSAGWNLLLLVPQQAVFWLILFRAYRTRKSKNLTWKGRNIYS